MTSIASPMPRPLSFREAIVAVALAVCLLWIYWPVLGMLVSRWSNNSIYSHGFLVPVFSVFLLWLRRDKARGLHVRYHWLGLVILLGGGLLRLAGAYVYLEFLEEVSLVVCLTGLVVFLGGAAAWRCAWPALAFLLFMVPLPFSVERALAVPLQRVATDASVYAMQTLGMPALAEGTVIHLHDHRLEVVEACGGLGMLVTFVALATGLAIAIARPMLDRVILVLSSIPVAVAVNVFRISFTGILHETAGSEWAELFHEHLAAFVVMPVALIFLWLELAILSRLLVAAPGRETRPVAIPFVASKNPALSNSSKPSRPSLAQNKA